MVGPGTVLMRYLASKSIKPSKGCNCYELARRMDMSGSEKVLKEIDAWTDKMMESIKNWKKLSDKMWKVFICPPKIVIKNLILWACTESDRINQEQLDG